MLNVVGSRTNARLIHETFKEGEFVEYINSKFTHHIPTSQSVERIELDGDDIAIYSAIGGWKLA